QLHCGLAAREEPDHRGPEHKGGPVRAGDHPAAQGSADHLRLPVEELHRGLPQGRRRPDVRRRADAVRPRRVRRRLGQYPGLAAGRVATADPGYRTTDAGTGTYCPGRSGMVRYLIPRLAESVVTFVLVTIVVCIGVRALPGDRPGRWPARRTTRPRWPPS